MVCHDLFLGRGGRLPDVDVVPYYSFWAGGRGNRQIARLPDIDMVRHDFFAEEIGRLPDIDFVCHDSFLGRG